MMMTLFYKFSPDYIQRMTYILQIITSRILQEINMLLLSHCTMKKLFSAETMQNQENEDGHLEHLFLPATQQQQREK